MEVIKNPESRAAFFQSQKRYPLSDSEKTILAVLNSQLKLGLDSNKQDSVEGLKMITKELVRQGWSIYDLHEIGISLRSIGVICLKIRGFLGYPYNPFGTFGIKKECFIY